VKFNRRFVVVSSVTAAACLSAAAVYAYSVGGDTEVTVPSPSAKAAGVCRKLHAALPAKVNGLSRHSVVPASDLTAGWGDPTVVLRCGVSRPDVLDPHSKAYNPTSDAAGVNGVNWLIQPLVDNKGYRFTTTDREVFVEVTVPHTYAPEINPLTDVAAAVRRTDPATL
jgi:Protein of unknown function (DUF3515)